MTFENARKYIANVSKTGSVLGLESIQNLMNELENVQGKLAIIHIAGTNGKGSTGAFLESALIMAGKRVGRYTSPAVFEELEVWRINKRNITKEEYASYVEKVKAACDRMVAKGMAHPTVFEVETALAFLYFYEKQCDYVLLEVGMGGATDATNLIKKPVCSVITSISMDHMQFLGSTLEEIAVIKAGIIKERCPVVTIRQKEEVLQVIREVAEAKGAKLFIADASECERIETLSTDIAEGKRIEPTNTDVNECCHISQMIYGLESDNLSVGISYNCPELGRITLSMTGDYQLENSYLAVTVLKEVLGIPEEFIKKGLREAGWPGRFETISEEPRFIIDGAHNEDAAEKLSRTLQKYFTNREITYIIGVLADKEYEKMLKIMLPLAQRVFTITPPNARALDSKSLAREAEKYHNHVTACDDIALAVNKAMECTGEDGIILAFGSLSYLKEVKNCIYKKTNG